MNRQKMSRVRQGGGRSLFLMLACSVLLIGCGSNVTAVRFKVNSEPEGSYVIYQMSGGGEGSQSEWIYLGVTPLRGVHRFSSEELEKSDTITLKVMQKGYLEQKVEWDGPAFLEEAEEKGFIFWAPELIPATP